MKILKNLHYIIGTFIVILNMAMGQSSVKDEYFAIWSAITLVSWILFLNCFKVQHEAVWKKVTVGNLKEAEYASNGSEAFMMGFRHARNNLQKAKAKILN